MLPKKLAAEAAPHKGRGEAQLAPFSPNTSAMVQASCTTACEASWIRSMSPSHARVQACSSIGLWRAARGRVHDIDLGRGGSEGGLGVADRLLQRLTHEHARLGSHWP